MRKKQAKNGHLNENRKFCDENGRLPLNSTIYILDTKDD